MATSFFKAQDVILCDLCEKTPVQMHCNLCTIKLCEGCVGRHISKDPNKDHNVVSFKNRKSKPIFPNCETHFGKNCEMYCHQCAKPACVTCIASCSFEKHTIVDLMELCNEQKNIIENKTKELEISICPKYEEAISETETQIAQLAENHEQQMTSISNQGAEWHQEIDNIIKRLKTEAEKMKIDKLESLKKHLSELKNLLSEIHQAIQENKKLLHSNNVANIMDHRDHTLEFDQIPTKIDTSSIFTSLHNEVERLNQIFKSLTTSSESNSLTKTKLTNISTLTSSQISKKDFLDFPKINGNIDTSYTGVYGVSYLSNEDVWVCGWGSHNLTCFNNQGISKKAVSTENDNSPYGMTVMPNGGIIYTTYNDRSIYIFKNELTEKMITVQDWSPRKICYTASGDLLIGMEKEDTPKKIMRYRGFTETQVIQFDEEGDPLLSTGSETLFIDENRNGDLCASDWKSKQVLIINQEGKLRSKYTGNLSSNKYKSFYPAGIVTDSEGHILIADLNNNVIHIISEDGHFIRYIENCQLNGPYDLSLDENNSLYVSEFNTSKVKIIQYLA